MSTIKDSLCRPVRTGAFALRVEASNGRIRLRCNGSLRGDTGALISIASCCRQQFVVLDVSEILELNADDCELLAVAIRILEARDCVASVVGADIDAAARVRLATYGANLKRMVGQ